MPVRKSAAVHQAKRGKTLSAVHDAAPAQAPEPPAVLNEDPPPHPPPPAPDPPLVSPEPPQAPTVPDDGPRALAPEPPEYEPYGDGSRVVSHSFDKSYEVIIGGQHYHHVDTDAQGRWIYAPFRSS